MSRIAPLLPFVLSLAAACTARGYSPSPTPTEDASQDLSAETSTDAPEDVGTPPNDVPTAPDAPVDMSAPPDLAPMDVFTPDTSPLDVIARDMTAPDVPPPPPDVPPPPPDVPPPPPDVPPPPMDVVVITPSQQIAAVRAAIPGATSLRVENVLVTYTVAPTIRSDGTVSVNDPGGFFVQADRTGPALFVAVDPVTIAPRPTVGDRVSFTVSRVGMSPIAPGRWVTEVSSYTRLAAGVAVTGLVQDVSSAPDLVASLNDYEHELVTASLTVTSDFLSAGTGFQQASVATAGLPSSPSLKLRVTNDVRSALALRAGCRVAVVNTPLWRFDVTAQLGAWTTRDLAVSSCPALTDAGADVPVDTGTPFPSRDEVWVVRVGDGTMSYSSSAAPVFIETYYGDTGVVSGSTFALPTTLSGANYPLTLTGNATGEGTLSRALDGRSVSLAGYTHAVGTTTAPSTRAPRVIASISPSRVIDTRTLITASPFDTAAVRVAASIDGSAFWTTHTNTSDGDVNYTLLGGTSFTAAVTNRLVLRSLVVTSAQLFATASLPTGSGVYATTSLPRSAASATMALLPGFPVTASMSPYGLAVFDTDANGAIDTIFLADDRALASGGGLLCWRFTTGIWSQVGPVAGLTAGLRGLTGRRNGTNYVFFATTAETRSRLVRIDVEGPTLLGIEATLATAPVSTAYRGVAFAPR